MRPIKFRAWHKNNKSMCMNATTDLLNRDYLELLQYTGLNDKNGKEIYERYIIKALNRNYDCEDNREEYFQTFEVTWLNGCFMFGNWNAHEFFNKFTFIEIVGNIYQNPELLEVKS